MAWRPFLTNLLGLDGSPESGGLLYSYVQGTSTPLPLYSDAGSTPTTNPVVADSLGQITPYFSDALAYSWTAKTANGATTLWQANVTAGVLTLTYVNPDAAVIHADWFAMLSKALGWVDVASASTTDLGATTSVNVRITGTTSITALGTTSSGVRRTLRFAGALTLTHNATSLILPGAANIVTSANDTAEFISLGSGNWICTSYQYSYLPRSGIVYAAQYVDVTSSSDQSTQMQAALTAAAGGTLMLPEGTIYCKALTRPQNTAIIGAEKDASILKLPAAADTYILADESYVNNTSYANFGGYSSKFTLDGNSSNQTVAKPLEIIRSYRYNAQDVGYQLSKGRGSLLTTVSANGTDLASGGIAGCTWEDCTFDVNDQEGWYGENGASNRLADWNIVGCDFNQNGGTTRYNCYSERSAGAKFIRNQMYTGGIGEARFESAGRMVIANNHIDTSGPGATSGNVYGIYVTAGSQGTVVIGGNIFHNDKNAAGSVTFQHLLVTGSASTNRFAVTGNIFWNEDFTQTAWTCGGSAVAIDDGNAYYQTTQPTPSANVRRGLQSDASGTWTLETDLLQALAGGGFIQNSLSGEGVTQRVTARYSTDATPPLDLLYKAGGTIESPANVLVNYELGRRSWFGRASGSFLEFARDTAFVRTSSPSSSDTAAGRYTFLAPDASSTMTEFMSQIYSVGLGLYGSTVIDANLGIRHPSFTSTALNAIANAVNTANKAAGKTVWNSTASKLVTAVGSTAGSVWVDGAGTTVNTPV